MGKCEIWVGLLKKSYFIRTFSCKSQQFSELISIFLYLRLFAEKTSRLWWKLHKFFLLQFSFFFFSTLFFSTAKDDGGKRMEIVEDSAVAIQKIVKFSFIWRSPRFYHQVRRKVCQFSTSLLCFFPLFLLVKKFSTSFSTLSKVIFSHKFQVLLSSYIKVE